jgi:hypothetical protein
MHSISRALDLLLRASGDPISELEGIGSTHPGHLHAEVIRAAVGVLAKVPQALPAITRAARAVDTPGAPPRLRAHLEAASLWVQGDAIGAARRYAGIAEHWPHDLLAMRLAQSCYFFVGQMEQACTLIDEVMKHWRRDARGFGFLLAMASFAHAESGHAARAEQLGRQALARDPACPMGVHAVAHAIAESGRPGSGAEWMRSQRAQWAVPSRMRTHNAWHLAMFDLDDGRTASATNILDTCLLPAAQNSPVDACDATSLLWRLAATNMDVGARWRLLSDAYGRNWQPGFWPYVDMHAVVAHVQAEHWPRFHDLVHCVERCAAEDHPAALRARLITLPFLHAVDAYRRNRRGAALTSLGDLRPLLYAAGGSRLQMETLAKPQSRRAPPQPAARFADSIRHVGEGYVDHYRQTSRGQSVRGAETAARQEPD